MHTNIHMLYAPRRPGAPKAPISKSKGEQYAIVKSGRPSKSSNFKIEGRPSKYAAWQLPGSCLSAYGNNCFMEVGSNLNLFEINFWYLWRPLEAILGLLHMMAHIRLPMVWG